jgi:hypothetical protein
MRHRRSREVGRVVAPLLAAALLVMAAPRPLLAQAPVTGDSLPALRKALYEGILNSVGTLPTATGGGFTYQFDPALGVFVRSTETLGPIFADRAETTGRGKFTIIGSYSRFTFDDVDGTSLHSGEILAGSAVFVGNAVRLSVNSIREDVDADVFTIGGLYGVTDRIDVGINIPILRVSVKERTTRVAFQDCRASGFVITGPCGPATNSPIDRQASKAENTGIGDIDLRAKYNFWNVPDLWNGKLGMAASLDVKLPTGSTGDRTRFEQAQLIEGSSLLVRDSRFDLGDPPLGTGIVRVRPQVIVSGSWFGVEPHINLGAELGETAGVTNDLVYATGLAVSTAGGRVTIVGDLLGRHTFDVKRRRIPSGTFVGDEKANPDTLTASIGVKINPFRTLIVFFNILKGLNNTGLQDDVTPTAGLEWSF